MSKDEISFKNRDRFIQLGIAISSLRKMRGMSQEQLAEKTGYARQTISRWEQGDQAITVEALVKILKVTRMQVTIGDKEAKVCIKIL